MHIAPAAAAVVVVAIQVMCGGPTRDHISRSLCLILAKAVPVYVSEAQRSKTRALNRKCGLDYSPITEFQVPVTAAQLQITETSSPPHTT